MTRLNNHVLLTTNANSMTIFVVCIAVNRKPVTVLDKSNRFSASYAEVIKEIQRKSASIC